MANSQRPTVNQRLYFARLHLEWMAGQIAAEQLPKTLIEQALGESLIMHLVMAYRAYLREIGEAYQLSRPKTPESAGQLAQWLAEEGGRSAECEELCALEQEESWLSRLQALYEALGSDTNAARTEAAPGGIHVQAVETNAYSSRELAWMVDALQTLIDKQRDCLEEW